MDKDTYRNTLAQHAKPVFTLSQVSQLIKVIHNASTALETYVEVLEGGCSNERPVHVKSWWGRHCLPGYRKTLYKHVTLVTLILQLINLLVLTIIDSWPKEDREEQTFLTDGSATMIILQSLNLVLLILATGRLVKQMCKHTVTTAFLVQAYLATALLFAGIYTTTFRWEERSWKFIEQDMIYNPAQVFVLYAKFLFYSISTATLCGSDNVLPVEWYNCLFAGLQMLLSFCYFASILGLAVSADVSHPVHDVHTLPTKQRALTRENSNDQTINNGSNMSNNMNSSTNSRNRTHTTNSVYHQQLDCSSSCLVTNKDRNKEPYYGSTFNAAHAHVHLPVQHLQPVNQIRNMSHDVYTSTAVHCGDCAFNMASNCTSNMASRCASITNTPNISRKHSSELHPPNVHEHDVNIQCHGYNSAILSFADPAAVLVNETRNKGQSNLDCNTDIDHECGGILSSPNHQSASIDYAQKIIGHREIADNQNISFFRPDNSCMSSTQNMV